MDLDLSLGPPRPGRRRRALDLGFDLALASPAPPPPSSASSSSSSSTEEPRAPIFPSPTMAEPPPFPYSPTCASFPDPPAPPPPIPAGAVDLSPEYLPYSPSYHPLGPPYAPIRPPLPATSYVRAFPADLGPDHGFPLHLPYEQLSPTAPEDAALVGGSGARGAFPHAPYFPTLYEPLSMIPEDREEAAFAQRPLLSRSPDSFVRRDDGSSSRAGLLDTEVHFSRLAAFPRLPWEGGHFFPASSPYGDERPGSAPAMGDPDQSEESTEISGKNKAGDEGVADEDMEEDEEEGGANAVNFECNICLELAKEPVVTPCGHLFCWPCLYQWLHLHCNYNECPVCKGEVMESEITPIYGRGSSEGRVEEEEDGDLGLKIPPRPRGRRSESWRQRIQRPISRRFGLEVASSWRRLFGEEVHFGSMVDVHGDPIPSLQQFMGVESTLIGRGSSTRVGDNMENGYLSVGYPLPWRSASFFPQNGSNQNSSLRGSFHEIWAQVSSNSNDRSGSWAASAVGPSRIVARTDSNANIIGASAPLLSTRNPGGSALRPPAASSRSVGQASASSTMAVIQGDVGIADAAVEPNSAGSSRNPRIRGMSSGSLYTDGCPLHACKGRRLN